MAYQAYCDTAYYSTEYKGKDIPDESLEKALKQASRHIDALTYNRIVGKGISNLTIFQQDIIKECCCELADFEFVNVDMIESVLQNYSINGVSMTFGESWNVKVQNGIAIRKDIYQKLSQTGLCTPCLGVRY